jgi:hypothetical protein
MRIFMTLLLLLFSLACSACQKGVETYPVTGQILVGDQPASFAVVTFHPVNAPKEAPRPVATTDKEGKFKLTTFKEGDGAPPGQYQVTVTWRLVTQPDGDEGSAVNQLPDRYAQAKTSNLTATVGSGTNALEPFRLDAQ